MTEGKLLNIHLFLKLALQESTLNVNLLDFYALLCCDSQRTPKSNVYRDAHTNLKEIKPSTCVNPLATYLASNHSIWHAFPLLSFSSSLAKVEDDPISHSRLKFHETAVIP